MHDRELFIDGRWRAAREGRRATIADPATGEPVGSTAIADAKDVDDAVAAAKRALPLWAGTHADERARILHRAADLIVERLDAIADLLTREQGKPIPDAVKEIRFGVDVIRYYAEEGRRIGGSIRASVAFRRAQPRCHSRPSAWSARSRPGITQSTSMRGRSDRRWPPAALWSSNRRRRRRSRSRLSYNVSPTQVFPTGC